MKNIIKYLLVLLISLNFSCSNDENQIVPEFLDGTEYGVILDVKVNSATDASLVDINAYSLGFDIDFKGGKRPVKSIVVNKSFVNSAIGESAKIEEEVVQTFPTTVTLSSADLVSGLGIAVAESEVGDAFNIIFVINYEDGGVVDRFDSSMRTNFSVSVVD